jgi:uncharacterized protein (TIGR03437 family)
MASGPKQEIGGKRMTRRVAISRVAFAFMIGYGKLAVAQYSSQTTLKIDLQDAVEYQAAAGEALSMYVTSLGYRSVIPPQVSAGGMLAEVRYFGSAPGYPGHNQVNFRLPDGVPRGPAVPLRLSYLNRPSNEIAIAVQ